MNKSHPKLVARGTETEDAGLKFKGAPADDCDPFAIQNYIDRLAAEVYDSLNPPKELDKSQEKDEWEHMKEKAKNVPFQDITLSLALKHVLMDEVKKENANKAFEKDSILVIMKVRDAFLREYADANAFEYQWQIWVEWERHLKQIGVTIPQWGKVARKLIRLGVQLIQEDMTKKYTQISSGANKRKQDPEEGQERRRRVTLPSDTPAPFANSPGFGSFTAPIMHRSSSFGGFMDAPFSTVSFVSNHTTPYSSTPSTPYSSTPSTPIYSAPSTPSTPSDAPFSPMQSPVTTSPAFRSPFETLTSPQAPAPFGASLYNMIQSAPSPSTNIFAASNVPPLSHPPRMDTFSVPFSNAASLPYPYDQQPTYVPPPQPAQNFVPHSPSLSSYPIPMQMQYNATTTPPSNITYTSTTPPPTNMLYTSTTPPPSNISYTSTTPPPSNISYTTTTPPTYMITSPSSAPPSVMSSPNFSSSNFSFSTVASASPSFMNLPPQFLPQADGTTHMF